VSAFERAAVARLIERAEEAGVEVPAVVRAASAGCGTGSTGAMLFAEQFPDAEPIGCCYGEAHRGIDGCTCWRPEYDTEQAAPDYGLIVEQGIDVRVSRCGDCAYRPDSPENAESYTADHLREIAASGELFWCHDGMRRPARWRHPQRDVVVEGSTADWRPPIIGAVPFRADGRPGLLCAGWAGEGRRQERLMAKELDG